MPNGFSVRSRIEAISRSRLAASKAEVPSVPKPPALETAATSGAVVALPMPPSTIGCGMPSRSQMRVRIMAPPFARPMMLQPQTVSSKIGRAHQTGKISPPLCSIGVIHCSGEVFSIQMKNSHQANRAPERGMWRRAIRPFDEFPNLVGAFFALDFHFKGNFLESPMFVTEVIEVFSPTIKPAAHVFFQ